MRNTRTNKGITTLIALVITIFVEFSIAPPTWRFFSLRHKNNTKNKE